MHLAFEMNEGRYDRQERCQLRKVFAFEKGSAFGDSSKSIYFRCPGLSTGLKNESKTGQLGTGQ